jgi:uncharacterized repeat protein (TIGR03803 family)
MGSCTGRTLLQAGVECAGPCGTIFEITLDGSLTTLYSFCTQPNCTDGNTPDGGLVQATNGDLYGTTNGGGAYNFGTVFKITPNGTLTTLHGFCAQLDSENYCEDGNLPTTGLIQATNGILYGTTSNGGAADDGTIFQITPSGKFTTLYDFQTTTGGEPNGLMQATDGTLYGTTQYGGTNQSGEAGGTVFSLSVGLGPFVETQTTAGKVGTAVNILGTDLTGATSVTFNGTPATFTVNSTGAAISATVPAGATTGTVTVTTPSGVLSSNKRFTVRE